MEDKTAAPLMSPALASAIMLFERETPPVKATEPKSVKLMANIITIEAQTMGFKIVRSVFM